MTFACRCCIPNRLPRLAVVIVLSALTPQLLQADDATLQSRVDELVGNLNAEELPVREAAEQSLVDLASEDDDAGEQVLALLPVSNDRMPPEVRHRLKRVRQAVEEAIAEATVHATSVTLAANETDVADVFEQITEQTDNQFSYEPDENGAVRRRRSGAQRSGFLEGGRFGARPGRSRHPTAVGK